MVGTSSFSVMTTIPLMRLSARTVVFSFVSSPALASPLLWFAGFLADDAVCELFRVRLPPLPDLALAFWFCPDRELDDDELPMRSFIMSLTSSASAYLRR